MVAKDGDTAKQRFSTATSGDGNMDALSLFRLHRTHSMLGGIKRRAKGSTNFEDPGTSLFPSYRNFAAFLDVCNLVS